MVEFGHTELKAEAELGKFHRRLDIDAHKDAVY
jgi:hypothetical protein